MRRYDIVLGIILMLSVIDIALLAPVSVQEKRQERVDAVHLPKEEMTVLGKRFIEDLGKLWEYFKTGEKEVELSNSAALFGPDHGSTNVVQPPAPGSALSTANPDMSEESPFCGSGTCLGLSWSQVWRSIRDDDFRKELYDSLHDSLYNPNLKPLISPEADHWGHWINAPDPPPRSPLPPKEFSQANKYKMDPLSLPSTSGHAPSPPLAEPEPKAATPSPPSSDLGSPKEPDNDVVSELPTTPDPKLHLDDQSLGTGSQLPDLQAAIYAAKGKAKESRHISNAAWDVGNAAQRDLQPVERSLDPEEDLGNL